MPSLAEIYRTAKSRKLVRTAAIYFSSSMTSLGVIDLISRHYGLTTKTFDVLLTLLLCGFPCVLFAVWLHAGEQKRKIGKKEIAVYGVLGLLAVVISVTIIGRAGLPPGAPDPRSVAVLPFQNLSDSKDDEYFSDGVTEDIITQLSKIGELKVISRTSVMAYKSTTKPLRQIGKELNVAAILEGSVRRERDRVRIVGQLIDARSDKHLWADTYDRLMTDIFAIQSEVAQKIAAELKAALSPGEKKLIAKKSTENIDAYAYYIKGREYYYRYAKEDNDKAIEFFRKALDLDPNYGLAYAGLGDAFARGSRFYGYEDKALDLALEFSQKAIALDADCAEGYKALGFVQETKGLIRDALNSYYKAVELNPNYAPAISNIGTINTDLGKYDEALVWFRKASVLSPGSARHTSLVAWQYYCLSFDGLSTAWFQKALEFQPDYVFPQFVLSYIDVFAGKYDAARARIAKVFQTNADELNALDAAGDIELAAGNWVESGKYFEKLMSLTSPLGPPGNKRAFSLLKQGKTAEAKKILDHNLAAYLENPRLDAEGSPLSFYVAEVWAMERKIPEALDWLEKAVERGYYDRWMEIDPLLENIRSENRFKQIMAKLQKKLETMRKRVRELGLDRSI